MPRSSTPRPLRLIIVAVALFLASAGRALGADVVTLRAHPNAVRYGGRVALSGSVSPAVAGETVGIYVQADGDWSLVANVRTRANGAFSRSLVAKAPGTFLARGTDAVGNPVDSAPVSMRVRPQLVASLRGSRWIGERLDVVGRVQPRAAGLVTVKEGDRLWRARVGPQGRFELRLTTTRLFRYHATVRLRPAAGYVGRHHSYFVRVKLRRLAIGARGPAVRWLEHSLYRSDHFALPRVDAVYDYATADAVLAFQEVHGLPRTGSVDDRFWAILRTSGLPLARIRSGDHIEVDKTRQLLFEVRGGEVVSVTRVSTGATGNTPVGHWHVYEKGPGYNAKGMYDSLYFVGNFAIHGYYSVPTYPASHGCVRAPLWFAPGFYSRWGIGTSVYVFA